MMNRKMKQLALAVGVALGGVGMLPQAEAVSVSADNMGQVLIFPYYTVRGGWNTLLGVTNTSNRVVAIKVRFREAYNSRDVFDFNLLLSPYDLWTGYLVDSPTGPVLRTEDNSCTVGIVPATGQPFITTAFTGALAADGGPTGNTPAGYDRLREGYVEMIMMGASASPPNALAANAVHVNGVLPPTGCSNLNSAFGDPNSLAALRAAFPAYPISPLKGTFSLVNASPGKGFNAVGLPVALNNFRTTPYVTLQLPPSANPQVAFANSGYEPTLGAATTVGAYYNATTDAVVNGPANQDPPALGSGVQAVTHALLASTILNEWTRRSNPAAGWTTITDWVVTFPTKHYYTDSTNAATNEHSGRNPLRFGGLPPVAGTAGSPFSTPFAGTAPNATSCDTLDLTVYDREERTTRPAFSPWGVSQFCYETNVLTFNQGLLLASPIASSVDYDSSYLYGWMNLTFRAGALPGVGFAITSRDSGNNLLSEAALYDHSYMRPVPPR